MQGKLPPGLAAALVLGILASARAEASRATDKPKAEGAAAGGTTKPASDEEPCGCLGCTLAEMSGKAGQPPGESPVGGMFGFDMGKGDIGVNTARVVTTIQPDIAKLVGLTDDTNPDAPSTRLRCLVGAFVSHLRDSRSVAPTGTLKDGVLFDNAEKQALGALQMALAALEF